MTRPVESALARFAAASSELLARRELLRRIDTKYILDAARLPGFIEELAGSYAVLAVGASNVATYRNLYFDTPELRCFHDHRRGRRIRQKIRIRHYPDRELSFLEVKTKRGMLITDKQRCTIPYGQEALEPADHAFLRTHAPDLDELTPTARIDYRRIALVNLTCHERLTIDFDLAALRKDTSLGFGSLVVVEVKRSPDERPQTPAVRALARAGTRERSLSKYCAALVLLSPDVRHNRLLPDLRVLEAFR